MSETPYVIYNPNNRPVAELPVIYGFNNGGSPGFYFAVLIAEDGAFMGEHLCSHEGYMPGDLGILPGRREDRHEHFRAHYPDGYRMDFVPYAKVETHSGLAKAIENSSTDQPSEPANESAA